MYFSDINLLTSVWELISIYETFQSLSFEKCSKLILRVFERIQKSNVLPRPTIVGADFSKKNNLTGT